MKIFGRKRRNIYEYCSNKIEAAAKSSFKPLDVDVVYCIIDHEVHVMQRFKWFKLTPKMFADGMGISIFEANDIIGFKKEESVLDETKIDEFLNKSVEEVSEITIEDEVPQTPEVEELQTLDVEETETPDVEEPQTPDVEEPQTPDVKEHQTSDVEEPKKESLVESIKEQFEESTKAVIKDVLNPKTFSDEPNDELISLKEENAKLLAKVQKYERLFGKIIDKTESK